MKTHILSIDFSNFESAFGETTTFFGGTIRIIDHVRRTIMTIDCDGANDRELYGPFDRTASAILCSLFPKHENDEEFLDKYEDEFEKLDVRIHADSPMYPTGIFEFHGEEDAEPIDFLKTLEIRYIPGPNEILDVDKHDKMIKILTEIDNNKLTENESSAIKYLLNLIVKKSEINTDGYEEIPEEQAH